MHPVPAFTYQFANYNIPRNLQLRMGRMMMPHRPTYEVSNACQPVVVCLFVWGFMYGSRIFHSCGDVTIAGERLKILTCAKHLWPLSCEGSLWPLSCEGSLWPLSCEGSLWPLSCEGSLACHTYCDTGHPIIMVISKDL